LSINLSSQFILLHISDLRHEKQAELNRFYALCCAGIFNYLLSSIKNVSDDPKQFKLALRKYLYAHSFYSVEEYFGVNKE
jgi:hypothetical protein